MSTVWHLWRVLVMDDKRPGTETMREALKRVLEQSDRPTGLLGPPEGDGG